MITEELAEEMVKHCKSHGLDMSSAVTRALVTYLELPEPCALSHDVS